MYGDYPWLKEPLLHLKSSETLMLNAFKKVLEARLKNPHDFFSYKGPILKPKLKLK